jgi:hypothetical protein
MKTLVRARRAVPLLLLLLSSPAFAADPWTTADTWRETAYLVVDAVDWLQTRNMARSNWTARVYGDTWYQDHYISEVNPIMGKHPSVKRVDRFFALEMLTHFGFAYALPKDWRAGFQYVSIGVELGFVQHNRTMGISAKF